MIIKFFLSILILFQFGSVFAQINWVSRNLPVNEKVRAVYFCDENTGFACAERFDLLYGDVYKTTNGGLNWFKSIQDFYGAPANIQFFDSNSGIVLGDRVVYKTTNRGVNWTYYGFFSSVFGTQCVNFHFVNSSTGVAFTKGGKEYYIIQTSNGGANWVRGYYSAGSTPKYPNFIFSDANTGLMIAGSDVKRTTNAGLNWSTFGFSLINARSVYKYNNDVYMAVGYENNFRSFAKTTNRGLNWSYQSFPGLPAYHSISFANQNSGFICGQAGLLQYTTNQGMNWIDYNLGTIANLYSIYFLNSTTGFIAGDSGKIFKTTNTGGLTNIISNNSLPPDFSLSQNYPNPFNPNTVISYQLPVDGFISLKIYDISGRVVKQLVNGVQQAGYYAVDFNAVSLSSGTYFYKLTSDKFSDVKKMVLVK